MNRMVVSTRNRGERKLMNSKIWLELKCKIAAFKETRYFASPHVHTILVSLHTLERRYIFYPADK